MGRCRGGGSAAAGGRPWVGGPTYLWNECRCVSECVVISKDQAGLAGEWMKWPESEGRSGSPRDASECEKICVCKDESRGLSAMG